MPKTFGHLWAQIVSFENLELAWRKARRGKRGTAAVASFEIDGEDQLFALQDALNGGVYRPGAYHTFKVVEHGKRRTISAAPFEDRVVHHALCQVIMPIWEARFHGHSYACRVGKGTHRAVTRCQQLARRYRYVLQCDVRQFFPSIDHAILRGILARHIADTRVLGLIDAILDSGKDVLRDEYELVLFPGDNLFAAARPRGLPIGNLTSQLWANCYLHPLDMFVAHDLGCPAYARYCDDFVLFENDKATLHRWRGELIDFAASLRLTLHEQRAQVTTTAHGLPWLGWVVYPAKKLLKRRCGIAFARRYRHALRDVAAGRLPADRLSASVRGWVAHAVSGDTFGLRRSLLGAPA
jgi:hypothetical protein